MRKHRQIFLQHLFDPVCIRQNSSYRFCILDFSRIYFLTQIRYFICRHINKLILVQTLRAAGKLRRKINVNKLVAERYR